MIKSNIRHSIGDSNRLDHVDLQTHLWRWKNTLRGMFEIKTPDTSYIIWLSETQPTKKY